MSEFMPNSELQFEADFSAARLDDGSVVKFTRLERRTLELFNNSHGRILTRAQILDAVSGPGSDKNDRNIDFLINRIRKKLRDVAQSPRFIGTQYGEGYVWLYAKQQRVNDDEDTSAVIGPFLGVESLGDQSARATDLAQLLQANLRRLIDPQKAVVIVPDLTRGQQTRGAAVTIQLGFFRTTAGVECIATARNGKEDRIVDVYRFSLEDAPDKLAGHAQDIAQRAITFQWREATVQVATSNPLPVAIYDALSPQHNSDTAQRRDEHGYEGLIARFNSSGAAQTKTQNWSWREVDRRLKPLREAHPDDPALKIMSATHIHAKYIKHGVALFRKGAATCAADEAEIERLVLDSLDYAQDYPGHTAMAAKLLYFVNQGYKDLALEMAVKAHRADASITSTLSVLGQLLGFVGEMEEAETHLSQAIALCEKGSMSQAYALYMLIQLYSASGERDKLSAALRQMYRIRPASMAVFEPFFTDPVAPSLRAKAMTLLIKRNLATAMLQQATYLSARLYSDPKHRENALLTPVNLFVRRFGPKVVPDETAIHLPGLHIPARH